MYRKRLAQALEHVKTTAKQVNAATRKNESTRKVSLLKRLSCLWRVDQQGPWFCSSRVRHRTKCVNRTKFNRACVLFGGASIKLYGALELVRVKKGNKYNCCTTITHSLVMF